MNKAFIFELKFVLSVLMAGIIFFFGIESAFSTHIIGQALLPDLVTLQPKDVSLVVSGGQELLPRA